MANKSDFSTMKNAGRSCIGCGKTKDHAILKKLSTYSRSYACQDCVANEKYRMCSNKNSFGEKCGHDVHLRGPCAYCGCAKYIHGLEGEHDRQLAACVGGAGAIRECPSFGAKMGTCGKTIFAGADGNFNRLCPDCDREWAQAVGEGLQDIKRRFQLVEQLENTENPSGVVH